jgi:hypothetical protein
MDWSGKEEFGSVEKREWFVDGERAGMTRSAMGFSFVTIDGAGHMVCFSFVFFFEDHFDLTIEFAFRFLMINRSKHWLWYSDGWRMRISNAEFVV